jgi:hypothetical protein
LPLSLSESECSEDAEAMRERVELGDGDREEVVGEFELERERS